MKISWHPIHIGSMQLLIALLLTVSCVVQRSGPALASSPVVIYKTKQDYRDLVSVQLSEDGSTLAAFPAPSDVENQRPLELTDGYLLKRMPGDVFLSLTIEEYAASARAYTSDELYGLIIDRRPFLEIYDCSACSTGDTVSVNRLIRQGRLKECKSLR